MDDFLTRLRAQARFCKYVCSSCKESYEEDALVETVVTNTCSVKLRQIAFQKKIISLDEVVQMGRALESAENKLREMSNEKSVMSSEYKGPKGPRKWQNSNKKPLPKEEVQQKDIIQCKFCGAKRAFVEARISGKNVKFLLDLGANVNLIPRRLVPGKAYPRQDGSITCFGGGSVPITGKVSLPLAINRGKKGTVEFLITEVDMPILGSEACLNFGLVSIHKPSFLCNEVSTVVRIWKP
ncbi:Uncharacterized protein FKW44_010867 [Caligus rogercresseyi]|uniref:Peptidase A2 domain-containing protein n=1 Tax=Caligus rogercresseyi TaxID=217165 RepID=A0A7T8HHI0_CALRO|nr:Uncharacterized protein FKW44_010867 [Caligus rogercresseyi]